MTTEYIYRDIVISPASDRSLLNALWTIVGPEGNNEVFTFGAALSANGQEPATHYGMNTAATTLMRAEIESVIQTGDILNASWWGMSSAGIIMGIHNGSGAVGQPWSWEQALSDKGLQPVELGTGA